MNRCLAVLNAGSSSIKFALYGAPTSDGLLFRGRLEEIGALPRLQVADAAGRLLREQAWDPAGFDHAVGTRKVLECAIDLLDGRPVEGVGHRVVHGGVDYATPVRVDAGVMAALTALAPLAPLHQPHNLAPIAAIAEAAPQIPQVACFDTAFHRRQPPLAQLFALPRELTEAGVRRYGFHGLSYEHVTARLAEVAPELADGRVIIAHLGNGASLCAVHAGRSVASTMGFTAADGLMMGTRSGALDPGVLLHLMDAHGYDARALEDLIYRKSGLLGVSGVSSDMRALRASSNPAAAHAIALFAYRVVREMGSMAAALGGLDALVFTGGIGEHDAELRAEVIAGCGWLGMELDAGRNEAHGPRITRNISPVSAWVIPTDEELTIARHTARLVGLQEASPTLVTVH